MVSNREREQRKIERERERQRRERLIEKDRDRERISKIISISIVSLPSVVVSSNAVQVSLPGY